MKKFLVLIAAAAAFIPAGAALGYGYSTCLGHKLKWSGDSKALRASSVSFPDGYWRDGLQDAVNRANLNPSNFRYSLATDSGGVGRNNGQSEVWGDTGSILNGAPAIAYSYWTCYWFFGDHVHMDEVDVIFDYSNPWQWTADTTKSSPASALARTGRARSRRMRSNAAEPISASSRFASIGGRLRAARTGLVAARRGLAQALYRGASRERRATNAARSG